MKNTVKKSLWIKLLPLLFAIFAFYAGTIIVGALMGGAGDSITTSCSSADDDDDDEDTANTSTATVSSNFSIDEFVKTYQEAYIESWGVGGFLPSASIAQTMIETSFSMNVPSFASAHNMGGVKGGGSENFPKTTELYGSDAVGSGTAGTSVGDNTGGSYTYFSTFEAGIVGKAEFMSRQTLYQGAINNTDGIATLDAIADGGWATDPSYKTKLEQMYNTLGSQYKWLDELAIEKYGTSPVNGTSSSSVTSSSDDDEDDDDDGYDSSSVAIDVDGAITWFENRIGKVTYSMSDRTGPTSYDCSSSIYFALTDNGASQTDGNTPVSTETEHDWLLANGYEKIYEGKWSSNDEMDDLQEGDIFIWGTKGDSSGSDGHTGMFTSSKEIIHCSASNNGIQTDTYKTYKASASDHGTVYIYRLKDGGDGEDNLCSDEETSDDTVDGTGTVPADATSWGYRPSELIDSLKQYVHNPEDAGLAYNGSTGWVESTGQCVALTESLGNLIWGHSGIVIGDGYAQAEAWAIIFGNSVKSSPKAGAIFSTNQANNHTGIVSHVFEDGSVLIIEQNTPLSGATYGVVNTWNYRIVSPATQKAEGWVFAYPDNVEPNWNGTSSKF